MKIELAKDEYGALLEMIYIADWVINAHDAEIDPAKKRYRDLEQKIYAFAEEMGYGHLVEHVASRKEFYPTNELELEGQPRKLIDEYDDSTFWGDLAERLAWRDLIEKEGEKRVETMEFPERFEKLENLYNHYSEEFEANGIDRLTIQE
jgi:hypothetical protein